jgi:DNA primase
MHVRILELEGGLDPDEYIKTHGADQYGARLDKAAGYFIWLADRARKKHDMSSSEGRIAGFQSLLMPSIRRISDRFERATVASEVADYLGIDRNLVLNEFRRNPAVRDQTLRGAVKIEPLPRTERILLRSLVADGEVRSVLLPALQGSTAARRFLIWPILEVLSELHENGEEFTLPIIESRLTEPLQALLPLTFFADMNEEVFSVDQAAAYVRVLESEDQKLQVESVRALLRQAERSGNTTEAFRLVGELNRLQKGPRR